MGLTLSGVAGDEDAAGGFIRVALVEVHENVRAVVVFANVKAVAVSLAAVIERIEIGN